MLECLSYRPNEFCYWTWIEYIYPVYHYWQLSPEIKCIISLVQLTRLLVTSCSSTVARYFLWGRHIKRGQYRSPQVGDQCLHYTQFSYIYPLIIYFIAFYIHIISPVQCAVFASGLQVYVLTIFSILSLLQGVWYKISWYKLLQDM